jgi:cell division protein FtsZ
VMANAGSALMGIGRASGDNRAMDAATQAISSPLLEVSIDGARGILFNVIGGLDMSMHEINTVAETITSAADTEANIIFGATINPDLEGEIIVTVVATGFDDSYFATRDVKAAELVRRAQEEPGADTKIDAEAMSGLDMELKDTDQAAADFHSDETPNIWALPDEENSAAAAPSDDELERPSFLRRLRRRPRDDDDQADDDATEPAGDEPIYPFGAPDDDDDSDTDDDSDNDEAAEPETKDEDESEPKADKKDEPDSKKTDKKSKK